MSFNRAGDTIAAEYDRDHNLEQTVIDHWAKKGFNVGPGGERLINGLPESARRVSPRARTSKAAGVIALDDVAPKRKKPLWLASGHDDYQSLVEELKKDLAAVRLELKQALDLLAPRGVSVEEQLRKNMLHQKALSDLAARMDERPFLVKPSAKSKRICAAVENAYEIPISAILGRSRIGAVFRARAHLAGLLIENQGWSAARVGRFMGRDHTTILNAYVRFKEMRRDGELCEIELDEP